MGKGNDSTSDDSNVKQATFGIKTTVKDAVLLSSSESAAQAHRKEIWEKKGSEAVLQGVEKGLAKEKKAQRKGK